MKKFLLPALFLAAIFSCDLSHMLGSGGSKEGGWQPNPYSIKYAWHVFRVLPADTTYFDASYSLNIFREHRHNGPTIYADTPSVYYDIYGELDFTVNADYNVPETTWLHLNISKAGTSIADTVVVDTLPRAIKDRVFYFEK